MSTAPTVMPFRGATSVLGDTHEQFVPLARAPGAEGEAVRLTATFASNGLVHHLRLQCGDGDSAESFDQYVVLPSDLSYPFAAATEAITTLLHSAGTAVDAAMRADLLRKAQRALVTDFSDGFAMTRMKYTTPYYIPPADVVSSSQAWTVASFGPHQKADDPEADASTIGHLLDALYKGPDGEGAYAAGARSRSMPSRALAIRVGENRCSVSLLFDLDPSLLSEGETRRPDITVSRDDCQVGSAIKTFWRVLKTRNRDWGRPGEEQEDEDFEEKVLALLCVAAKDNLHQQTSDTKWNIRA